LMPWRKANRCTSCQGSTRRERTTVLLNKCMQR
jgi:hypothetical protein